MKFCAMVLSPTEMDADWDALLFVGTRARHGGRRRAPD